MNMFNGILFIGNLSVSKNTPWNRVDKDFPNTLRSKINQIKDICKKNNYIPVFTGGISSKKFDLFSYSFLLTELIGMEAIVLSGSSERKSSSAKINEQSQSSLLSKSNIIKLIESNENVIEIPSFNGDIYSLLTVNDNSIAPSAKGYRNPILAIRNTKQEFIEPESEDFNTDDFLAITSSSINNGGLNCSFIPPIIRDNSNDPSPYVLSYDFEKNELIKHEVNSQKDPFKEVADFKEKQKNNSEFAKMLLKESMSNSEKPVDIIKSEFEVLITSGGISSEAIEIIDNLIKETSPI